MEGPLHVKRIRPYFLYKSTLLDLGTTIHIVRRGNHFARVLSYNLWKF